MPPTAATFFFDMVAGSVALAAVALDWAVHAAVARLVLAAAPPGTRRVDRSNAARPATRASLPLAMSSR